MTLNRHFLILPGWQGSGDNHWQTWWQSCLPNAGRLEVADWHEPDPQDWAAALNARVAVSPGPVVLIAHSLGCVNTVNWAAQAHPDVLRKVEAALLVAPADVERPACPQALQPFAPISRRPLPFPARVLGSLNDAAATAERVQELAEAWQIPHEILGEVGHINVASGHHQWEEGFRWLYQLLKDAGKQPQAA